MLAQFLFCVTHLVAVVLDHPHRRGLDKQLVLHQPLGDQMLASLAATRLSPIFLVGKLTIARHVSFESVVAT